MDRSRKATRQGNEDTLQHVSGQDAERIEALAEERLTLLQANLEQWKQTPAGGVEFQRRLKAFGPCTRLEGEHAGLFHDRLLRWREREAPPAKSPRHPPRQVE